MPERLAFRFRMVSGSDPTGGENLVDPNQRFTVPSGPTSAVLCP